MTREDEPLFPDEILSAAPTPDAVFADIESQLIGIDPDMRAKMLESQLAIKAAGVGVLTKLVEKEVPEAVILQRMLEAREIKDPHTADPLNLSTLIGDAALQADNQEQRQRFYNLGKIAYIAGTIGT